MFLLVVLFFFVGASASGSPSSFSFLSSILSSSFSFCCLSSVFGLYVFLFLCFFFSSSCFFSFSCVSFSSSPMLLLSIHPFFPASLRVSRLIVLAVAVLVLIPPLSHLVFFFSPGPRANFTRKTMEETHFILFAFRGSLRKCPFTES